jgi:riboflavin kinase/FMN adenylyltransferase
MPTRLLREELRRASPGRPSAFTIGVFDGVHRGHQFLMRLLKERAAARGLASGVITLHPHPLTVVRPGTRITYLSGLEERLALIRALGVDVAAPLTFTGDVSRVSAEEFIELLGEELQARFLLFGPDFALGRGREGAGEHLVELARPMGIEVEFAPAEEAQGHKIGSRDIRTALAEGDVEAVHELLGRPYALRGPVVHGAEVGRQLGFPTANIGFEPDRALPGFGVYAACARVGGRSYAAATSIGIRPTVNTGDPAVEAYLLDFDGELYGTEVELDFVKRLRGEEKFGSLDELIAQIKRDVEDTRAAVPCNVPVVND